MAYVCYDFNSAPICNELENFNDCYVPCIKDILKHIKFTETNSQGKKFNFTLHKFPIYTKDEIEELKKTSPKLYQMLLAY